MIFSIRLIATFRILGHSFSTHEQSWTRFTHGPGPDRGTVQLESLRMTAGDEDDCLMNGFSGSLAQRLAQSLSPAIVGMGATGARSAARMPPRGRTWAPGPCGAHPQPGRGSWGRSAQAWWACAADIDGRLVFHKRPCFLGVLHDQTPCLHFDQTPCLRTSSKQVASTSTSSASPVKNQSGPEKPRIASAVQARQMAAPSSAALRPSG